MTSPQSRKVSGKDIALVLLVALLQVWAFGKTNGAVTGGVVGAIVAAVGVNLLKRESSDAA